MQLVRAAWLYLKRQLFKLVYSPRRLSVPVGALRSNRSPYACEQGFGGRPIEEFPPSRFFRLSLEDQPRARDELAAWYRRWFVERQAWRVPKRRGGMDRGSLWQVVAAVHEERLGVRLREMTQADPSLVEVGIEMRVEARFELLASLRQRGFVPDLGPPVSCRRGGDGLYYLEDGHHRVAALWALGATEVVVEVKNYPRFPALVPWSAGKER